MEEGDSMRIRSEEIKRLRFEKALSMRKLASMAGVSMSQISDLENGQLLNTTIDTICKLAIALECEPADLFTCD